MNSILNIDSIYKNIITNIKRLQNEKKYEELVIFIMEQVKKYEYLDTIYFVAKIKDIDLKDTTKYFEEKKNMTNNDKYYLALLYYYIECNIYKSIKMLKKLVDVKHLESILLLGSIYIRMSLYDKAKKYFIMSLDIKKTCYAYNNIGYCYVSQDDSKNALEYYNKCNDLKCSYSLKNIGYVHYRNKNIDEAIKYYKMSVQMGNYDAIEFYYNNLCKDIKYEDIKNINVIIEILDFKNIETVSSIRRYYKKATNNEVKKYFYKKYNNVELELDEKLLNEIKIETIEYIKEVNSLINDYNSKDISKIILEYMFILT